MTELEVLKESVGQDETQPPKYIRGQSDSAGGLRLSFSIDECDILVKRELPELILDEFANLLNIATLDLTLGIEILHFARELNENYRIRFGGASEVYGEEELLTE